MMRSFYYAYVDENGVLVVDCIEESTNEVSAQALAIIYPGVIYFMVDNRVPEFRVPFPR